MMAEPVMLEVRERRGPVGRVLKWLFIAFQVVTILGMLGTCALFPEFMRFEDQELALQSAAFTGMALAGLWLVWPLGTLVLGVLVLLTRGRKRLIAAPAMAAAGPPSGSPSSSPPGPIPGSPPRPGGSVPRTGPQGGPRSGTGP